MQGTSGWTDSDQRKYDAGAMIRRVNAACGLAATGLPMHSRNDQGAEGLSCMRIRLMAGQGKVLRSRICRTPNSLCATRDSLHMLRLMSAAMSAIKMNPPHDLVVAGDTTLDRRGPSNRGTPPYFRLLKSMLV